MGKADTKGNERGCQHHHNIDRVLHQYNKMIDDRDIPCNQTNINPGIWVVHYNYRLKTKIADN